MNRLLKAYGFNSDMQYFERIVFLYRNGDMSAARVMFSDMPTKRRKQFCITALREWQSGLTNTGICNFIGLI